MIGETHSWTWANEKGLYCRVLLWKPDDSLKCGCLCLHIRQEIDLVPQADHGQVLLWNLYYFSYSTVHQVIVLWILESRSKSEMMCAAFGVTFERISRKQVLSSEDEWTKPELNWDWTRSRGFSSFLMARADSYDIASLEAWGLIFTHGLTNSVQTLTIRRPIWNKLDRALCQNLKGEVQNLGCWASFASDPVC